MLMDNLSDENSQALSKFPIAHVVLIAIYHSEK